MIDWLSLLSITITAIVTIFQTLGWKLLQTEKSKQNIMLKIVHATLTKVLPIIGVGVYGSFILMGILYETGVKTFKPSYI